MIIGGDFVKHGGNSLEKSWLCAENSEDYILTEKDLVDEERDGWVYKLINSVMKANFPNFIFEIPWMKTDKMRKDGMRMMIKSDRSPIIYYLLRPNSLYTAVYVCTLGWDEFQDEWSDDWFRIIIKKKLEERRVKATAIIEENQAILGFLDIVDFRV